MIVYGDFAEYAAVKRYAGCGTISGGYCYDSIPEI